MLPTRPSDSSRTGMCARFPSQFMPVNRASLTGLWTRKLPVFDSAPATGGLPRTEYLVRPGVEIVSTAWAPDGERILELSTKCAPTEGFQVAAETRAFLADQGVDLYGEQQTKTKTALDFFARNLQEQAAV